MSSAITPITVEYSQD